MGINGEEMEDRTLWKYCVVGNIVASHYDAEGNLRYGTPAYIGGTKVYLAGKNWGFDRKEISVVGLTRGKRLQVHEVAVELIENVRCQKVYKPSILNIIGDQEFSLCWWNNTKSDKTSAEEFVTRWRANEAAG